MKHDVRPAQPGEINGSYFDRFTLVHFASGYAFGKLPISNIEALVIAVGWEIIEDRLKEQYPAVFPNASLDTKENALTDAFAFMLAFFISQQKKKELK